MALAFLSKKSFHPTNFNNQESVWKAEQAEAEEQRKLDEWKSKREEERQIEELRRLQRESGQGGGAGPKKAERVDFLYEQQAPAAQQAPPLGASPSRAAPPHRRRSAKKRQVRPSR